MFLHSWTAFKNLSTLCFCFTSWSALFINWKPLHTLFSIAEAFFYLFSFAWNILLTEQTRQITVAHICLVLFSPLWIVITTTAETFSGKFSNALYLVRDGRLFCFWRTDKYRRILKDYTFHGLWFVSWKPATNLKTWEVVKACFNITIKLHAVIFRELL